MNESSTSRGQPALEVIRLGVSAFRQQGWMQMQMRGTVSERHFVLPTTQKIQYPLPLSYHNLYNQSHHHLSSFHHSTMRSAILLFLIAILTLNPRRKSSAIGMADANMIQDVPLRINPHVTVVGTSYVGATQYTDTVISIPEATEPGDMLVIYVGGSHAGKLVPSKPIPRAGWEEIIGIGPSDLNLKAFYKPYESYNDIDTYKVTDGKSTFVAIIAIRGLNKRRPVVDSGADKDVVSGREGGARAPSVQTEDDGLIIASYVYDDPHVATIMGRHHFDMILSTDTRSGDGMAIGVKSTSKGKSGYIYAEGQWQPGGGNEIGMTISFRSAGSDGEELGEREEEEGEEEEETAPRPEVAADYFSGASAPPEEDVSADKKQVVAEKPMQPSPSPTEDVVDLLPADGFDNPQYGQLNQQDTTPLLIGVIVGLLIFSTVVIAAAIKYRRDAMQDVPSNQSTKQSEVTSSKRDLPVRWDTYFSDSSHSDEEDGPPRSESWLSFQSDVDSALSAIEEGKVVCDPLPRSASNASTLTAGEMKGFAEFIQPSTSFPPPPPPPL